MTDVSLISPHRHLFQPSWKSDCPAETHDNALNRTKHRTIQSANSIRRIRRSSITRSRLPFVSLLPRSSAAIETRLCEAIPWSCVNRGYNLDLLKTQWTKRCVTVCEIRTRFNPHSIHVLARGGRRRTHDSWKLHIFLKQRSGNLLSASKRKQNGTNADEDG